MASLIQRLQRAAFYLASMLVGILSLMPAPALPPVPISDKAEHVIAYALLGLLGGVSSRRHVLRTILGLAAFGVALELLQSFSPGRWPDAFDALANVIGACIGGGAAAAIRPMTSMLVDRVAGHTRRCRACVAGGDADANSSAPAVGSSSSRKRPSCPSN